MDDLVCKMSRKELMDEVAKFRMWLLLLQARTPHKWLKSEIESLLKRGNHES